MLQAYSSASWNRVKLQHLNRQWGFRSSAAKSDIAYTSYILARLSSTTRNSRISDLIARALSERKLLSSAYFARKYYMHFELCATFIRDSEHAACDGSETRKNDCLNHEHADLRHQSQCTCKYCLQSIRNRSWCRIKWRQIVSAVWKGQLRERARSCLMLSAIVSCLTLDLYIQGACFIDLKPELWDSPSSGVQHHRRGDMDADIRHSVREITSNCTGTTGLYSLVNY